MRLKVFAGFAAAAILLPSAAAALPAGPATPSVLTEDLARTPKPTARPMDPLHGALRSGLMGTDPVISEKDRFRDALIAFYEDRDFQPVWIADGALTPAARATIARLGEASADGLDPADYVVTERMLDTGPHPDGPDLVAAELSLSRATMAFARDAQAGRINPRTLSSVNTQKPPIPDPLVSLKRVASASDPAEALDAFNPPHPQFQSLKKALYETRNSSVVKPLPVPAGRNLRPGDTDPRVGLLRQRLGVVLQRGSDVTIYDDAVVEAVKAFQSDHGLRPDGIIGPNTLAVLNRGLGGDPVTDILVNMERWRWMPRDLGKTYVFVNIPAFTVTIRRDGTTAYEGRVIVGKPTNPTPMFSDEIEHLVVNPYWNVPYSIASKEMLSSIQKNPSGYFSTRGYEAVYKGKVVNPSSINWSPAALRDVRIRQKPGNSNALGHIKFMFPNEHAVYLHDTPSRSLFAKPVRAFSHGCVRVDDPLEFADALLAEEAHWNAAQIKKLIGGSERYLPLEHHIPVHLAYFTEWVDADGTLVHYSDIYGQDRRLAKLLTAD